MDDSQLNVLDMVEYLSRIKEKSGTACPGTVDYLEAFGDADAVFCFTITGGLSGSYNVACLAKREYEELYPGRRVFVTDSLSAGPEMSILVEKAGELIAAGKDYDTICQEITEYKKRTGLLFSLQSLKNLANNGRVNPLAAKIAGVLGIRMIGCASEKGELNLLEKCRGEKKALDTTCSLMKDLGFAGGKVRIDHCCNEKAAVQLQEMILKEFADADVQVNVTGGLCSFYAEKGGLMIGFEKV